MAHRHSRLRHHRRRKAPEVFKDAFGRPRHKAKGDVKPPTTHRKTRHLTPIHDHIEHHRKSRLRKRRRKRPKLP